MIREVRREVQYEKEVHFPVYPADAEGLSHDKQLVQLESGGYVARWRRWETILQYRGDSGGFVDVPIVREALDG